MKEQKKTAICKLRGQCLSVYMFICVCVLHTRWRDRRGCVWERIARASHGASSADAAARSGYVKCKIIKSAACVRAPTKSSLNAACRIAVVGGISARGAACGGRQQARRKRRRGLDIVSDYDGMVCVCLCVRGGDGLCIYRRGFESLYIIIIPKKKFAHSLSYSNSNKMCMAFFIIHLNV